MKLTPVHDALPDGAGAAHFREGWAPILSPLNTFCESGTTPAERSALAERDWPR